jgi:Na+-translocating ferredoxin:NAD+ oxidoreductase RNF subunit RnfB
MAPSWQVSPGSISLPAARPSQVTAAVNREHCIGCGRCVSVCPAQAIAVGADGKATVECSLCRGCGACVQECPVGAVHMTEHREDATTTVLHRAAAGREASGGERHQNGA